MNNSQAEMKIQNKSQLKKNKNKLILKINQL